MLRRIVEITGEGKLLHLERGFLAISENGSKIGSVPLDDVEAVIAATPALHYSGNVIDALAARGTPLVICGARYTPTVWMLPVNGHHAQAHRMEAQAAMNVATRKRLWTEIVSAKIEAQAEALKRIGAADAPLRRMKQELRSGDAGNSEALAAQYYFPAFFSKGFKRDRGEEGPNALLNYGYTILRACAARAIVGAGLHPSFAVFHQSRGEAMRLADDLMEPFRPSVDLIVRALMIEGKIELVPDVKRRIVSVLHQDFKTDEGRSPLSNCMSKLASSLAQVCMKERKNLVFPHTLLPLPDEDNGVA
jgi:CRISP-associated protein Cas1